MESQIVTITFFRFAGRSDKFWAFSMMQNVHPRIAHITPGLSFYKLLGSGGEDGFSWKPNFSVYGLLCVWQNIEFAIRFFDQHPVFMEYKQKSVECFTTYMTPLQSHGNWSGVQPFVVSGSSVPEGKIAVITRATIRPGKLLYFWRKVAGVSKSLESYEGRRFSIGIGEWPLIQQATFSIWDSFEKMSDYAYKNPFHKKVVRLTREKNWYKEELFARFQPIKVEGVWEGKAVQFLD